MRRLALSVLLAVLALPGVAGAATIETVYEDCQDGRLDRRYPKPLLAQALKHMSAEGDEYSTCGDLIRDQRANRRGGGGAGPGSTFEDGDGYGPLPAGEGGLPLGPDGRPIDPRAIATPAERSALDRARAGAGLPPEVAGVAPTSHGADLPGPLAALLAAMAGAAAALAGARLWRRARGRSG